MAEVPAKTNGQRHWCYLAIFGAVLSALYVVLWPGAWPWSGGCPDWLSPDGEEFLARSKFGVMKKIDASDLSKEMFLDLVSRAEPFVIRSAFTDWPAMQEISNCSVLRTLHPNMVYFDWQGGSPHSFGSVTDWACHAGYLEQGSPELPTSDGTSSEMNWGENRKVFKEWLSSLPTPGFMPANSLKDTPGMSAFIGTPNTGVTPHLDENCANFMTIQFCGKKRWSVSWPELSSTTGELQWADPLAVDLDRGDALIWYMSQMHHTEVLDGCSFSLSVQFNLPAPHIYYMKLKEIFESTPELKWRHLYQQLQAYNDTYMGSCSVIKQSDGVWMVNQA